MFSEENETVYTQRSILFIWVSSGDLQGASPV